MASPVGHAFVGVAAAGVTAKVTGAPQGPLLWLGAFVASGAPDLDLLLHLAGRRGPQYHRNHSHSVFVLTAIAVALWLLLRWLPPPFDAALAWPWVAALFTHPLLDVVTSGPSIGARGYGIALFWPVSARRIHSREDLFDRDTGDWGAIRSVRDFWWRVKPEVLWLGLPSAAVLVAVLVL